METTLIVILWFGQAFVFGYLGSKRKIGFVWTFIIALAISPLAGIIALLVSKKQGDLEIVFPELDTKESSDPSIKNKV